MWHGFVRNVVLVLIKLLHFAHVISNKMVMVLVLVVVPMVVVVVLWMVVTLVVRGGGGDLGPTFFQHQVILKLDREGLVDKRPSND